MPSAPTALSWLVMCQKSSSFTTDCTDTQPSSASGVTVGDLMPGSKAFTCVEGGDGGVEQDVLVAAGAAHGLHPKHQLLEQLLLLGVQVLVGDEHGFGAKHGFHFAQAVA